MTSRPSRRAFLGGTAAALAGVTLLDGGGRALAQTIAPGDDPIPPTGDPKGLSPFGFMFPNLDPFAPDPDPGVASAQLMALASSLLDPNVTAPAPGNRDNTGALGSVLTYLGQFIDHDLFLDIQPQPVTFFTKSQQGELIDPAGAPVLDFETFRLDLSSMYGGGPEVSPQLYEADKVHLRVVESNANGVRDLPRNADGSAVLVEKRNDENQVISQVHVAMMRFHNAVADALHTGFTETAAAVRRHYQWVVLHQFLPEICGQQVVDGILDGSTSTFYKPGNPNRPLCPVEVSVAAYRFGHSIVRRAYELTTTSGKLQVFNGTPADLAGGRPLGTGRQIDWGNFVRPLARPENAAHFNVPRLIDTLVSSGLFTLPIGGLQGSENAGSSVLPFRNLIRGLFYRLPSGQDVAAAMGIPVISPAAALPDAVDSAAISDGFGQGTPLWFYVLRESELAGGQKLGPVGARLVADVFTGIMAADPDGLLHDDSPTSKGWRPAPPVAPAAGVFGIEDLLTFAGVAVRP